MVDITLSKVYLLAELSLFLYRQMDELYTLLTAAAFIFFLAGITLDEQQMTGFIGAIDMGITGRITLVAIGNDIIADAFSHPLIKDEILANKFIF